MDAGLALWVVPVNYLIFLREAMEPLNFSMLKQWNQSNLKNVNIRTTRFKLIAPALMDSKHVAPLYMTSSSHHVSNFGT